MSMAWAIMLAGQRAQSLLASWVLLPSMVTCEFQGTRSQHQADYEVVFAGLSRQLRQATALMCNCAAASVRSSWRARSPGLFLGAQMTCRSSTHPATPTVTLCCCIGQASAYRLCLPALLLLSNGSAVAVLERYCC